MNAQSNARYSPPSGKFIHPSRSGSDQADRKYVPGRPARAALLPAELNHVMPLLTALAITVARSPVPSPGPSYGAVCDRLMMRTPLAANQSTAACMSTTVSTVAR